ncbi:glucose 1-dehydrogenase [Olivibacter sp. XZL3]|uniref:glucose 1-dehydrogenase n=1 Tax=Olivibacter sp. XZL3 TaxID=1735116 RepID=UPI001066A278|nr:glucose 1-dehydrogenase [Olivibacter sp. XZL3]
MTNSNENMQDPQTKHPAPPFPMQEQDVPGVEREMKPKADHGEESYRGTGKLKGKKAIITGGDSGIGKAVAIAFAREGADVLISYLADVETEDAKDTAKWVEEAGAKALLVKGDISDESHCRALVEQAVDAFGQVDILVNNAAFQMGRESLQEIPEGEWEKTFATNIHSMYYLCKAVEPHMKKGGSVINTTSVNAYSPTPLLLAYAATKGAIQNFTSNLAQLFLQQKKGIRVNAVAPGPVWTPLIPSTMPDADKFGEDTPMGRPGQPVEMAPIYVFLASDESSYISGATIPATGGRAAI